jgi:hypothetical protein
MENQSTNLETIFNSFCAGKKAEMASKEFLKSSKDCGLLDKKYVQADADVIFAKVKDKTAKTINYNQFINALKEIAKKKGVTYENVVEAIQKSGGAKYTGTQADYVKFHDDKSTYTGVYAKGGPTTVDSKGGKVSDIAQICDRTSADVRGVKK